MFESSLESIWFTSGPHQLMHCYTEWKIEVCPGLDHEHLPLYREFSGLSKLDSGHRSAINKKPPATSSQKKEFEGKVECSLECFRLFASTFHFLSGHSFSNWIYKKWMRARRRKRWKLLLVLIVLSPSALALNIKRWAFNLFSHLIKSSLICWWMRMRGMQLNVSKH